MIVKKGTSLLVLVVMLSASVALQGCGAIGAIGSIVSGIVSALGNSNIMGSIGSALGAAGNIAQVFGSDDTAQSLGEAGEVVQAVPGAVEGAEQTFQNVQDVFNGEGRTTSGVLQDDGTLADTANRVLVDRPGDVEKENRSIAPSPDRGRGRQYSRTMDKYEESARKIAEGLKKTETALKRIKKNWDEIFGKKDKRDRDKNNRKKDDPGGRQDRPPEKPGKKPGGKNDQGLPFNWSDVEWVCGDEPVADWPQTINMTSASIGSTINWSYDKPFPNWPRTKAIHNSPNACLGFVTKVDGKWCGGIGEWLLPGQTVQARTALLSKRGDKTFFKGPMKDFKPKSGQEIYMFVCGLNWVGQRNVKERSNLVKVTYP